MKTLAAAILMAILFTGCSITPAVDRYKIANSGISRSLDSEAIAEFSKNQVAVISELTKLAGLSNPPSTSDEWKSIIWAGIQAVDNECHIYMSALYRIDQRKKEISTQLNLLSTTTAAVQGILDEAAKTVALTSTGFGFLTAAFTNLGQSILFNLPPAAVNELVRKLQQKSKTRIAEDNSTIDQAIAMNAIYQYAEQCTPIRLETEVGNALQTAKPNEGEGILGATLAAQ